MADTNDTEREEWRPIPEYEGVYEVSNQGRVRSFARGWSGRLRTPVPDDLGYLNVILSKNKVRRCMKLHCLVMLAFAGPPPEGMEVNHKDGNKGNCARSNLEYVTHGENVQHAFDTGLQISLKGIRHPAHKLTEDEAREVYRLCKTMKQRDIALRFGISQVAVSLINRRINWKHVNQ